MSWNVKIGQKVYHSHTVICILVLAFQIYFEMRGGRTYFDEGLALVCMFYVIMLFLKKRLDSSDPISVFLLIVEKQQIHISHWVPGLLHSVRIRQLEIIRDYIINMALTACSE